MLARHSRHIPSDFTSAFHRSLWLSAAAVVLCAVGEAQELKHVTERPGTWKLTDYLRVRPQDAYGLGLTAGQRAALAAKMDTLVSILRPMPVFNPPIGVWVDAITRYSPLQCEHHDCKVDPPEAEVWIRFVDILDGGNGRPARDDAIASEAYIQFNSLGWGIGGDPFEGPEMSDGRRILFRPEEASRIGALTTYYYHGLSHLVLAVAKPGRAVWVPVTREQFISALIRVEERAVEKENAEDQENAARWAEEKKRILESGNKDAIEALRKAEAANEALKAKLARQEGPQAAQSGHMVVLEPLRAELARLSPAERASPAWYKFDGEKWKESGLVAPNTPNSRQLVTANPEYFDRSLPRTAIQVITVVLECEFPVDWMHLEGENHVSPRRAYEFLTTADWARVAKLIE
jgi:hypothetical protein